MQGKGCVSLNASSRTGQPVVDLAHALGCLLAAFGGGLAQGPLLLGAVERAGRQGLGDSRFACTCDGAQAKLGLDLLLTRLVRIRLRLRTQTVVLIAVLVGDGGGDAPG